MKHRHPPIIRRSLRQKRTNQTQSTPTHPPHLLRPNLVQRPRRLPRRNIRPPHPRTHTPRSPVPADQVHPGTARGRGGGERGAPAASARVERLAFLRVEDDGDAVVDGYVLLVRVLHRQAHLVDIVIQLDQRVERTGVAVVRVG